MRKLALILMLCLPALYYVGTVLSWEKKKKLPITGDEPHYLMISESLAVDGDLDLKNNYEQDAVSKKIIGPVDMENHTVIVQKNDANKQFYSIHSIGTSVLSVIGYKVSGILGAKIMLALFTGILPFLFYPMGRILQLSPFQSAAVSILYSVSLPFPMAAGQIFPDLPSGILLASAIPFLLLFETNHSFKNRYILLFAYSTVIGASLWIHLKNLPVAILILTWPLLSKKEWNLKSKTIFLTPALVSSISLVLYNILFFGSYVGPYARAGRNFHKTFDPDVSHWITVFSGLWMDRNQGLFFQNPLIWIPGLFGCFFLMKDQTLRKIGILLTLVIILQLGINAGHPCSYGCLSLPGRFQWSSAPLFFLPFLAGWKIFNGAYRKISWGILFICVAYQIWIGKIWFDHTASLYHTMEPDPTKRPGFLPDSILPYLPSWTDINESWKSPINWAWILIFLSPIPIYFLWIRNNPKMQNGLNPLIDRETNQSQYSKKGI
ncbi:hypothetical protein EHQ83_06290 [Leptospira yasudae]|uniref:Glycosyltransferase RgtA/B/C/D-like domain-containing protein n=1 Tax=Leptospira yasudae TaxID=2202201 RepID=A0A6N4QI50_9LEPT|nr:hypothetical protein [Leptospira yasudae]TGL77213.1 hypothetical protein EHQ77_16965 [Leptospira yasudae]TGL80542.1 hypothetical protein EHQ72_07065 [Leptospira yasudae]TGL85944.1 hypothetical protein EHQ83_06290 [Leptospira yasudae]